MLGVSTRFSHIKQLQLGRAAGLMVTHRTCCSHISSKGRLKNSRKHFKAQIPQCCVVRYPGLRSLARTQCTSSQHTPSLTGPNAYQFDVVALGNLCVDVVVTVDELPPADVPSRQRLLEDLSKQMLGVQSSAHALEVGGNCNFLISAARLGLRAAAVAHTGSDAYGKFLGDVLKEEGNMNPVVVHPLVPEVAGSALDATLVCYVLVDPASQHAFCSSYDFGPWPLFRSITALPPSAVQVLRSARALFTNGFVFDELPLEVVRSAVEEASSAGCAVFFDPGPRCFSMQEGQRQAALRALLDLSDVVLMTKEEAAVTTGQLDPEAAARWVLHRPGARTRWCIVKLGGGGSFAMACTADNRLETHFVPAIEVEVVDTVGCGDSFAAAVVVGYLQSQDLSATLETTLKLANAVGAATAMKRGAGRNVAAANTVMSLLQREEEREPMDMLRSSLSDV